MTTPDRPVMTEEKVREACDNIKTVVLWVCEREEVSGSEAASKIDAIRDLAIEALRNREQKNGQ